MIKIFIILVLRLTFNALEWNGASLYTFDAVVVDDMYTGWETYRILAGYPTKLLWTWPAPADGLYGPFSPGTWTTPWLTFLLDENKIKKSSNTIVHNNITYSLIKYKKLNNASWDKYFRVIK